MLDLSNPAIAWLFDGSVFSTIVLASLCLTAVIWACSKRAASSRRIHSADRVADRLSPGTDALRRADGLVGDGHDIDGHWPRAPPRADLVTRAMHASDTGRAATNVRDGQ